MTLNPFIYKRLKIKNSYGGKYLFACILLLKLLLTKHFCFREGGEEKGTTQECAFLPENTIFKTHNSKNSFNHRWAVRSVTVSSCLGEKDF